MGKRLYVGNINYKTTEDDLKSMFEQDGMSVVECKIISDRETGRSRGFGFVEMGSEDEAQKAIESLDGTEVEGRTLRVSIAHEKKPRRPGRDRW